MGDCKPCRKRRNRMSDRRRSSDESTFLAASAGSAHTYTVTSPKGTTKSFSTLVDAQRYALRTGGKITQ